MMNRFSKSVWQKQGCRMLRNCINAGSRRSKRTTAVSSCCHKSYDILLTRLKMVPCQAPCKPIFVGESTRAKADFEKESQQNRVHKWIQTCGRARRGDLPLAWIVSPQFAGGVRLQQQRMLHDCHWSRRLFFWGTFAVVRRQRLYPVCWLTTVGDKDMVGWIKRRGGFLTWLARGQK